MYIVLKSFAGKEYSGTKGKTINIDDKKFANTLKKAGYIADYTKSDKTNAEKDKEIVELKSTISQLESKVANLEKEKVELLEQIESLNNPEKPDDIVALENEEASHSENDIEPNDDVSANKNKTSNGK